VTKTITLKDGTPFLIRDIHSEDLESLMRFYRGLPEEERKYLRVDVMNQKTVEQRLKLIQFGYHHRLGVFLGEEMVGEAALELPFEDWRQNQGELRLIVSPAFQRKGLGTILTHELFLLAKRKNVETLSVWMMKPQHAARNFARKMGFQEKTVLPSYVRDQDGEMQDLFIMKSGLNELLAGIEAVPAKPDQETGT